MGLTTTLIFAGAVVLIFHMAIVKSKKSALFSLIIGLVVFGWVTAVAILGPTDFFTKDPLIAPNIMLGFLLLFILLKKAYSSNFIKTIADNLPQHWLIGIQTYRLAGISFLNFYKAGFLPAAFAFPAGFGDILVGITAPFVAYAYFKNKPYAKKLAIAWNLVGILDLVTAIGIGIFGFQRPIQLLPLAPSTELLSSYPLVLIPLFAVPLAFILHLFSLRTLTQKVG